MIRREDILEQYFKQSDIGVDDVVVVIFTDDVVVEISSRDRATRFDSFDDFLIYGITGEEFDDGDDLKTYQDSKLHWVLQDLFKRREIEAVYLFKNYGVV